VRGLRGRSSCTRLAPVPSPQKIADVRVNKLAMNVVAVVVCLPVCAATLILARVLPHHVKPAPWHALAAGLWLILLIFVHEGLHAIALMHFSKLPRHTFKFGILWKALTPYCHCTVPVNIQAYRRMGFFPLYVTGSASLLLLLIYPADVVGLMTGLTWAVCIGDVWLMLKLRKFPDQVLVQDHPSEIGCDIFAGDATLPAAQPP
jgi:hypothetical protein